MWCFLAKELWVDIILRVVGEHIVRAAKVLVVSELMAIFYTRHGKS
jgi:hypothetical protein